LHEGGQISKGTAVVLHPGAAASIFSILSLATPTPSAASSSGSVLYLDLEELFLVLQRASKRLIRGQIYGLDVGDWLGVVKYHGGAIGGSGRWWVVLEGCLLFV